jgi:hypothetical protein
VPDPFDTQSFNRHSYVNNRPLSFTDPSGYWPDEDDPDDDDIPQLPCDFGACPDERPDLFPRPTFPFPFTPGYIWPSDGLGRPLIIPPYRTVVGGPGILDQPVPAQPNDDGQIARDPLGGNAQGARRSWDQLRWYEKWN